MTGRNWGEVHKQKPFLNHPPAVPGKPFLQIGWKGAGAKSWLKTALEDKACDLAMSFSPIKPGIFSYKRTVQLFLLLIECCTRKWDGIGH
jgi:hypothetical protein